MWVGRALGSQLDQTACDGHGVGPTPGLGRSVVPRGLTIPEQAAAAPVDLQGNPAPVGILADDEAVILEPSRAGAEIADGKGG